jgi:hypothetical protein
MIPLTPFAFIAKAANLGPDLLQQSEIISSFQNEGGGHKTLQVCCVCGVNDFNIYLEAENIPFSEWWFTSPVKLTESETNAYKQSRTEGYLNLSVLQSFAASNHQSLKWAYQQLYEVEEATDATFKQLCNKIVDPIILQMIPHLMNFSDKIHVLNDFSDMGTAPVCKQCKVCLQKDNKRPYFSMGGDGCCNFGYPKYVDGVGDASLHTAEILSIAKARPYVHTVKAVKDESASPNTALKGHIITFQQSEITEKLTNTKFPLRDFGEFLSIMLIGSFDPNDLSSSDGKDLIKNGIFKGVLKIRTSVVNNFVRGLQQFNALYAAQLCQFDPLTTEEVDTIHQGIPVIIEQSKAASTIEKITTSDVAEVRNQVYEENPDFPTSENPNNTQFQSPQLPSHLDTIHIFKANSNHPVTDPMTQVLHSVLKSVQAPGQNDPIELPRSGQPMNEFTQNDELITAAFPHLFFKGISPPSKGSVNANYVRHLLSFHDGRFARDISFVLLLFDQYMRHAVTREVKAKVSTDPKRKDQIDNYLNDDDFPNKLRQAIAAPTDKVSLKLFSDLNSLVMVTSASIPFSLAARNRHISKMYSMTWYFGLPALFNTWSPDDVHNIDSIHQAVAVGKKQDIGFNSDSLIESVINKIVSEPALKDLASSNPVALARVFHRSKFLIYKHIIGLAIDGSGHVKKRRSTTVKSRRKGAFGVCLGATGVDEVSGRHAMHHHMLMWLLPLVDSNLFSEAEDLIEALAKGLDDILRSEISVEEWIQVVRRREAAKQRRKDARNNQKVPSTSEKGGNQKDAIDDNNENEKTPTKQESTFLLPSPTIRGALVESPDPAIICHRTTVVSKCNI